MPEGTPFCAACGAPQIRVVAPQSSVAPALPDNDLTPPPLPGVSAFPLGPVKPVRWGAAFRNCLVAAAITTVVILVAGHPLLILFTLPAGGWFAVFLYARRTEHLPLTAGVGARIGAVTGLTAFGLYAILMAVVLVFQRSRFLEEIKKAMTQAAAQNPNPQTQQVVEKLMSPEGIAVLVTISAVFLFFVFLVLCSVGGAIGGSMAKGKSTT